MKKKLIGLSLIILCGIMVFLAIYLGRPGDAEKQRHTAGGEGVSIQSKENVKEERIRNAAKITVKNGEEDSTLYWEDIDLDKMGVCADYLDDPFVPHYSQVSEGHYYYMRHALRKEYSYYIYQDEGKNVGKFNLDGDMELFLKYKNDYYVSYYDYYDYGLERFSRINTEKGDIISSGDSGYDHDHYSRMGSPIWLYDNHIFYYPGSRVDEKTGETYDIEEGAVRPLVKAPINNPADITEVKMPDRIIWSSSPLVFVDGKIMYGQENDGEINLYSYDMETETELKIFSFRQEKRRIESEVKLQFDRDYIYCGEYLIPLSGGSIQAIDNKNKKIDYSYSEQYIYYIDKEFHVHRIDKKTKKDTVISRTRAMKVDATDQAVYVQEYNKALYENKVIQTLLRDDYDDDHVYDNIEWDWYSCAIYRMDPDGGHLRKIADEVTEDKGVEYEYFPEKEKSIDKGELTFSGRKETKDVTVKCDFLGKSESGDGMLYQLKLDPAGGSDIPGEFLNLGYYFIRQKGIFHVLEITEKQKKEYLEYDQMPEDADLVCWEKEKDEKNRKKGLREKITVEDDMVEYRCKDDTGATGFYETMIWKKDVGMILYRRGYGAESNAVTLWSEKYIDNPHEFSICPLPASGMESR